jgi:hypothetical protein
MAEQEPATGEAGETTEAAKASDITVNFVRILAGIRVVK